VPVASLGNGYFVIADADELERVLQSYRDEIATKRERMAEITAAFSGGDA